MAENKKAPGEVRSNTQVITRSLLAVIILIVVGFCWPYSGDPKEYWTRGRSARPPR